MDVAHPPGDRIVHRYEGQGALAGAHGLEDILEGGIGGRLVTRKLVAARGMAVRSRLALIGDVERAHLDSPAARLRAASRSLGVSTEIGASETTAAHIVIPSSRARSCSRLSRRSNGEGAAAMKRVSAARR